MFVLIVMVRVCKPSLDSLVNALSCGCQCKLYDVGTCETRFTTECEVHTNLYILLYLLGLLILKPNLTVSVRMLYVELCSLSVLYSIFFHYLII